MVVCLVSLKVYDKDRSPLPYSDVPDDMPTGIACPLCNTELYANATIQMHTDRIPAWCTSYFCPWRGTIRRYY
jgi:hypothetical protein